MDRGEISAWFQPQFDLATGALVGAEALCRWTHPQLGIVPPAEFIPLAEASGEIERIGRFMAEQSYESLVEWSELPHPIDVSVNVSPAQLITSSFTDWITERMSPVGGRRGRLTLEITESLPLQDVAALVHRLDRLRSVGFGVAIDDFGVGQSSLVQLRRLHGTELKLDRSLVNDLSDRATEVLRRAIEFAHGLGIRVVAEGIETAAQLARMRELGCDRAQGFLLGRPMSRVQLRELLSG
jgi:EAL domain-containing protein (putative c-di-GMP-specific phosphodiesterase class I)